MDLLLGPLRERLGDFQLKVEAFLERRCRIGRALRAASTQIDGLLFKLNDRLSVGGEQPHVSALKGSSKKQGDWGEVLLERMLEDSGLRAGHEYRVQESFQRVRMGRRARPDVILSLPGEKHLVIDSKVSLVDYTAYCDCEEDGSSGVISLAKHIGSMRQNIYADLSKRKDYHAIYESAARSTLSSCLCRSSRPICSRCRSDGRSMAGRVGGQCIAGESGLAVSGDTHGRAPLEAGSSRTAMSQDIVERGGAAL